MAGGIANNSTEPVNDMNNSAFLINPVVPCVEAELLHAFESIPTAHISDVMGRLPGAFGLHAYHGSGKLVGTALTVKTRPGDNLMVHHALDIASRGHVIVVDGGADLGRALVGEIMTLYAKRRGIAGFVIDGAVRDVLEFARHDFPCYARGHTHRGPYKDGPGQINVPVVVAGMVVNPGDLIVGDADGVVAVPIAEANAVLQQAILKASSERKQMLAIEAGTLDRSWVQQTIKEREAIFG